PVRPVDPDEPCGPPDWRLDRVRAIPRSKKPELPCARRKMTCPTAVAAKSSRENAQVPVARWYGERHPLGRPRPPEHCPYSRNAPLYPPAPHLRALRQRRLTRRPKFRMRLRVVGLLTRYRSIRSLRRLPNHSTNDRNCNYSARCGSSAQSPSTAVFP